MILLILILVCSDCAKPTKNQEQSETKKYNSAFAVNNGISKPTLVNPATKAKDLKIDTSFIGITGYSSGGHLAALAGASSYDRSVEGNVGKFLNFSSHIDAVVDFYGPTDMSVFDGCLKRMGKEFKSPRKIPLFDNFVDQVPKEVQRANPITYIKENSPPFLIFHGENDLTVPICQSKILHEALLKKGVNSELIIDKYGDHCCLLYTSDAADE